MRIEMMQAQAETWKVAGAAGGIAVVAWGAGAGLVAALPGCFKWWYVG